MCIRIGVLFGCGHRFQGFDLCHTKQGDDCPQQEGRFVPNYTPARTILASKRYENLYYPSVPWCCSPQCCQERLEYHVDKKVAQFMKEVGLTTVPEPESPYFPVKAFRHHIGNKSLPAFDNHCEYHLDDTKGCLAAFLKDLGMSNAMRQFMLSTDGRMYTRAIEQDVLPNPPFALFRIAPTEVASKFQAFKANYDTSGMPRLGGPVEKSTLEQFRHIKNEVDAAGEHVSTFMAFMSSFSTRSGNTKWPRPPRQQQLIDAVPRGGGTLGHAIPPPGTPIVPTMTNKRKSGSMFGASSDGWELDVSMDDLCDRLGGMNVGRSEDEDPALGEGLVKIQVARHTSLSKKWLSYHRMNQEAEISERCAAALDRMSNLATDMLLHTRLLEFFSDQAAIRSAGEVQNNVIPLINILHTIGEAIQAAYEDVFTFLNQMGEPMLQWLFLNDTSGFMGAINNTKRTTAMTSRGRRPQRHGSPQLEFGSTQPGSGSPLLQAALEGRAGASGFVAPRRTNSGQSGTMVPPLSLSGTNTGYLQDASRSTSSSRRRREMQQQAEDRAHGSSSGSKGKGRAK